MSSSAASRYFPELLGKERRARSVEIETQDAPASQAEALAHGRLLESAVRRNDGVEEIDLSPTAVFDEVLLTRICAGEKDALASLFRRYARLVRAVAYQIIRDEFEADDLVQDLFLFIHRKANIFDSSKSSARSWIVQMTYHRAVDRRRYLNSRHFYTNVDLDDALRDAGDTLLKSSPPDNSIKDMLGIGGLQKVFEALSENQRQTLQLHFFEGYTLDEIAAKLQQTRGNIKNHYFRGLDKLRKQIFACNSRGH